MSDTNDNTDDGNGDGVDWSADAAGGTESDADQFDTGIEMPDGVDDDTDDDTDSRVDIDTDRAKAIADSIGSSIASGLLFTGVTAAKVPLAVLKHFPKGVAVGQALHKTGINLIKKKSGSQFVAYTIYGDDAVIPRPAGIDSETQWVETDNGEEWVAENGLDLCRVGKTPVAFGVADDHEMVSPIRARLAEKIDSGGENWRVIREHDTGHVEDVNYGRVPAQGNGAVADGGVATNGVANGPAASEELTPEFDDIWVDLSNWVKDADGMVVSMKKAYETTHQKGTSEALEDAEKRGRIAEQFADSQTKWAIYLLLTAIGCFCLGLFGPAFASTIAGSAGGAVGGGGLNPLTVTVASLWV